MSRLHGLLAACVLACTAAAGSAPDEISGTVIDSDTGQPISHARVTAIIRTDMRIPTGDALVALTDDDGHFRFSGLPKSECEVRAAKAGYQEEFQSRSVPIRPDIPSSPETISLTPVGWLIARVVGENGSPVDGAQVAISRRPGGPPQYIPNLGLGSAGKDGTRRAALPRGAYGISALSPGTGTLLRARGQTFLPTYYPSTTSISGAQWIEIVPGKEVQAEVHVTLIPARQVRGRLAFAGTLSEVSILPFGSRDYSVVWGLPHVSNASGEFRVFGLTPGSYVLDIRVCLTLPCTAITMFRKTVQVLDSDIDNLMISDADRLPSQ